MKFLVLALCVYAASAAPEPEAEVRGSYNPTWQSARPAQDSVPIAQFLAKSAVNTIVQPAVLAKKVYDGQEVNAVVVNNVYDNNVDSFKSVYETSNGISAQAAGSLKKVGDDVAFVTQGGYSYNAPDGTPIKVEYIADENGFQARGSHIPVGPPTPEAILRSLEYIRTHPNVEQQLQKKF